MEYRALQLKIGEAAMAAGFADWEITYLGRVGFEMLLLEREVSGYENSQEGGMAFRGNYKGRTGYAYTENLEGEAAIYLVEEARENALLFSAGDVEELFPGEVYPIFSGYAPNLGTVLPEKRIAMAKRMEDAALHGADTIASLDYCVLSMTEQEVAMINSAGLDVSYRKNFARGYVSAIARKGEETKTGSAFWKGQDWASFDPEATGRKAAERAAALLGAKSIPSGRYSVIISGQAMTSVLSAFSGVFFAENVQKGFSFLQEKLGEKIANACVTLRDDAVLPGGYASVPFDSEGVAGRNKGIIEDGILKTYLYNRKSAKKDGVSSTGNGFRGGLTGSIKTACTNFYLTEGADSLETLCENMRNGVLITSFMGLHAGANGVSGDFSLSAEGFMVVDGALGQPVEQITVAGNFYEMLLSVLGVGNDLYFSPSGVGAPSLWVERLSIAGN